MMTALALAERGIKPMIMDDGNSVSQRSFACALHARSLEILEGFDLWDDIVEWGRRIETIGLYDGVGAARPSWTWCGSASGIHLSLSCRRAAWNG